MNRTGKTIPRPVKAVIFDMDGVIFDSERLCIDCWKTVARKYSLPHIEETILKCIGTTSAVTERIILEDFSPRFTLEDVRGFKDMASSIMREAISEGRLLVKPGVRQLLCYLRENDIPAAIASSTRSQTVICELSSADLLKYFSHVTGGEMAPRSKPAPDIFLKAAETLGEDITDCAVIEDSFNGIRAAKSSGALSIMVPDLLEPDEEIMQLADYIFPDLLCVLDFFNKGVATKCH